MKDPIVITLGVLVRYALVWLAAQLAPLGINADEASGLTSPEVIASIVAGVVALGWGLYTRLRSKMKQKLALELPQGATEEKLDKAAAAQPMSAVLKATPK